MELVEKMPGKLQLFVIVLAVTSLVFGTRAVAPALADIAKAFPERSRETIQMIVTLPPLFIMFSTLICGQLSRKFRKKPLVLIGMLLFGIGGISPTFFGDLNFLLLMMAVLGAGNGFLVPLSQSLVADYFEGRDREVFMGYRSSNASIFGMIFSLLGGSLCAIHWRLTFLSFLLAVPMLLLVLFKMPAGENPKAAAEGDAGASLTGRMWFYVAMYFLFNIAGISIATNAAFVMSGCGIGTRTIGIIMTISAAGSITAGIVLGYTTKAFKHRTIVLALGFLAAGFNLLIYVRTPAMFTLGMALFGFGFGTFIPTMVLKIIGSVPKAATTLALSILTCALGTGQFVSPIFYSFINGLLGLRSPRASWIVAAACFSGAFVAALASTARAPKAPKISMP